MDKIKNNFRNNFFSTFQKITVGWFVNQLIKQILALPCDDPPNKAKQVSKNNLIIIQNKKVFAVHLVTYFFFLSYLSIPLGKF